MDRGTDGGGDARRLTTGRRPALRIAILASGTEGDVRPVVALGVGLAAEGHAVTVAADPEFGGLVRSAGLGYAHLAADLRRLMAELRGRLGDRPLRLLRAALAGLGEAAPAWAMDAMRAADGASLVMGTGGATYIAASVAERLDVPFVRLNLQPREPNRRFPPVSMLGLPEWLPGGVNLALHAASRRLLWAAGRAPLARMRAAMGLAPFPRGGGWRSETMRRGAILNGFSPLLVPGQEGERIRTTGAWTLGAPEGFAPPAELAAFLASGRRPVFVGFGSMMAQDPAALAGAVVGAARRLGHRVVLAGGWGGFGDGVEPAPDVVRIGAVPHDWLFPRMAMAVHHCGAGTTHAGLRAGIASVPVPFLLDQFFWADRLAASGVAPRGRGARATTVEGLATAMAAAGAMAVQAERVGAVVRAETGVADAIGALRAWGMLERAT